MDEKNKDGPEIESWEMQEPRTSPTETSAPDAAIEKIKRHSYRGPVRESEDILVELAGSRYRVLDIGSKGLGVMLPTDDIVRPGDVHAMELMLQDESFPIRGKIQHISPNGEAGGFHCGIEMLDMNEATEQRLQEFILRQRSSLFAHRD